MENIPSHEHTPKTSPHELIKDTFIKSKNIEEFFDSVFKLDQSGTHVEHAAKNIELLEDEDILREIESFKKNFPGYSDAVDREYNRLLSLSYFHKAQKEVSLEDFKKSYEYNLLNNDFSSILNDEEKEKAKLRHQVSSLYQLGTIKYLEGNTSELRNIIRTMPVIEFEDGWEVNTDILKQFLLSLEQGENPVNNYHKRYDAKLK